LKKELNPLKAKIKKEEHLKIEAQARADKKEGDLHKYIKTLLGKLFNSFIPLFLPNCFIL
jgi:hypothetical protein